MKRLFWVLLGAIAVWLFARRRMDGLYAEISRLREFERRELAMDAKFDELEANAKERDEAHLASLTPKQRMNHELKQARVNSILKERLGEDLYNEYKS